MELALLFFNSFVVGLSGALMPGPVLAIGIAETPRHGWKTGPIISIGHAISEIAVVVILAIGSAAIAENETVTAVIGVVGGIALILMGVTMGYNTWRSHVDYSAESDKNKKSRRILAAKGITTTLSNPYWFVWWATTGLAFLVRSMDFGWIGPVVFYFGHIMSDFVWYTVVSILIWQGKRILMGQGLKILITLCSIFLVYLGIVFISDGLS